jgi:hypothetical protein
VAATLPALQCVGSFYIEARMASATLTVTVRVRWWVMPYIRTLAFFCNAFHVEPDMVKVERMVMRGLYCDGLE